MKDNKSEIQSSPATNMLQVAYRLKVGYKLQVGYRLATVATNRLHVGYRLQVGYCALLGTTMRYGALRCPKGALRCTTVHFSVLKSNTRLSATGAILCTSLIQV